MITRLRKLLRSRYAVSSAVLILVAHTVLAYRHVNEDTDYKGDGGANPVCLVLMLGLSAFVAIWSFRYLYRKVTHTVSWEDRSHENSLSFKERIFGNVVAVGIGILSVSVFIFSLWVFFSNR
jgi:hypothetical protein